MTLAQDIAQAVETLNRGGIIVYPTDTVWGIGCDATDSQAVRRVYEIKRRADSKALITLVASEEMLRRFINSDPSQALALVRESNRPTTVVYPDPCNLSPVSLAPDGSAGIRISNEAVSSALCSAFGSPIVSTSANISGMPSPSVFRKISDEILDAADYVMEARRDDLSASLPSRVLRLMPDGSIDIIRP